jgi:hypothetical protein
MNEIEADVAKALAKVAVFPSKVIVAAIAERNLDWARELQREFPEHINWSSYFYPGSACVFPGVRRKQGIDEQRLKRVTYYPERRVIIDENEMVRNTWTFLSIGKRYAGYRWSESGLSSFELAHCLPHKSGEIDVDRHLFSHCPAAETHFGLFTCASNVALVPKGMAKPTGGSGAIRAVFLHRYVCLYGDTFAAGFKGFRLPDSLEWHRDLVWRDPLEPKDWEMRVDLLDTFRRDCISKLLRGRVLNQAA